MILSLYDFTGYSLRPWAEGGHRCLAVDLLHASNPRLETFPSGGSIEYLALDLHNREALVAVFLATKPKRVFGFPVCTDLAGSGARHWKKKAEENKFFQVEAIAPILWIDDLCRERNIPFILENPKGLLSTVWRQPDWSFSPHEYGGYLPEDDKHPMFDVIPSRDRYTKETYIWAYLSEKPPMKPVEPIFVDTIQGPVAPQYAMLGGKSQMTKTIRSATPRGFAYACFAAYKDLL